MSWLRILPDLMSSSKKSTPRKPLSVAVSLSNGGASPSISVSDEFPFIDFATPTKSEDCKTSKQKTLANQFDKFHLVMNKRYDHDKATPSPVKNRFPGHLTAENGRLLLEEQLGYVVVKELGTGCYGTAFSVQMANHNLAIGKTNQKRAVCKTYMFGRDYNYQSESGVFGQHRANRIRNFCNEASLFKQISHEHIVQYYSCFQIYSLHRNDSQLVLVHNEKNLDAKDHQLLIAAILIEEVDLTLDCWISRNHHNQFLPVERVQEIFFQIGSALQYLHRDLNICHMDIKADNCGALQRPDGRLVLKLFDFSNSRQFPKHYYDKAETHSNGWVYVDKENQPKEAEPTDNPFLRESWTFANFLMNISTVCSLINLDEADVSAEDFHPRGKFIKNFHGDDKLKTILLRMAPKTGAPYPPFPKELVSINWAVSQFGQ